MRRRRLIQTWLPIASAIAIWRSMSEWSSARSTVLATMHDMASKSKNGSTAMTCATWLIRFHAGEHSQPNSAVAATSSSVVNSSPSSASKFSFNAETHNITANAVTRNLFPGEVSLLCLSFLSLPFPSFYFSLSFSPPPRSGPSNIANGFGVCGRAAATKAFWHI